MEQVLWFGWFQADIVAEYAPLFWHGLQMTILVTVICIVQGTGLGLLLGIGYGLGHTVSAVADLV